MLRDVLKSYVVSIRAQIIALQVQVDALEATVGMMQAPEPSEPVGCSHPTTENIGTFGAPQYRCTVCGAIVAEPVPVP